MKSQEIELIIELAIEGEATDEQLETLTSAMSSDPALLEEVRTQFALHGSLSVELESEFSGEKFIQQTQSAMEQEDKNNFSKEVISKIKRNHWKNRIMLIAALVIVGVSTVYIMNPFGSSNPENGDTIVASLQRTDGVQWTNENDAHQLGKALTTGQSIKIDAGLLEVNLNGRGSLVIEGPAHLDFTSSMEAVLHRGSLVMSATELGHGYTVKTPNGKIVDLGTEFAVSVDENNTVETHVITGSVEAVSANGKSVTLKRNDALRFDDADGKSILADVGKFYTSLPPIHQQTKSIHWSFDEGKNLLAKAVGELGKQSNVSNDLVFNAADEGSSPKWIQGIVNTGIYLDGKGAYAQSNYKGIQGSQARTVCFWLKVPKKFSLRQGFGIVSWGSPINQGETWQISVNPLAEDGAIGRLRLGLHGGQIVGSTDLRDDEWHHIAVVLYGGSQPNVGTHALLYVDGKKEAVSRASLQEVKTITKKDDHGVWVGRNVTYRDNSRQHGHGRFFRGGIDELSIFDAALSQNELKEIMQKRK